MNWVYTFPRAVTKPLKVLFAQYQQIANAINELQDNVIVDIDGDSHITVSIADNTATLSLSTTNLLPTGGDQYEVLQKDSSTNYDASWGPVRALSG